MDAILDSHFPEVTAHLGDSILSSPELGRLVHLVINALLYSTSLPLPLLVRESPLRKVQRSALGRGDKKRERVAHRLAELRSEHSAEDVFFLPGRVSISQVRQRRLYSSSDQRRQAAQGRRRPDRSRGEGQEGPDRRSRVVE